MRLRMTLFDGPYDVRALSRALATAGASVREVRLVPTDQPGGRVHEDGVEVLLCPSLVRGPRPLRALHRHAGRLAPGVEAISGDVPSVVVWRTLVPGAPGDVFVASPESFLARGFLRDFPAVAVVLVVLGPPTCPPEGAARARLVLAERPDAARAWGEIAPGATLSVGGPADWARDVLLTFTQPPPP